LFPLQTDCILHQSHSPSFSDMANCDVAVAIAEFVADPMCTSLELPHMTTGQRKSTKKLLEQHSELQCESYGFGAERQLHLFKKSAVEAEAPSCGRSQKQVPEAVAVFKSCDLPISPVNAKNVEFATIVKKANQGKHEFSSPDRTTAASMENSGDTRSIDGSPVANDREFPMLHEELRVRNTFIHMEGAPIDQRAVQSMPHGMFRRCLFEEFCQVASGYDTPTTDVGYDTASEPDAEFMASPLVVEAEADQRWALSIGALVVVEGLEKCPAFNGRSAVVQGWDEATSRYNILLACPEGSQQAKIKEENLRVVLPCPL